MQKLLIGVSLFTGLLIAGDADRVASLADAAEKRDLVTIRALLSKGANINQPQGDGMTALHWAIYYDDIEAVRLLISAGANLKTATRNGQLTPLFLASKNGSAAAIHELLIAGVNPNDPNATGATPLMIAAASGNIDAVTTLLNQGAEVNAKDTTNGQTALMYAAALNRAPVVKLLLDRGADSKIKTKVTKLERLRVDMDGNIVPQREGTPPADASKSETGKEVAPAKRTPTKAGDVANMGPRESGTTLIGGMTALLFAARDGNLETVRVLLDSGADVNAVNESEKTSPLVMAILNGHYDVASFLLSRGADPNLVNTSGLAALFATIDVQWAPKAWYPQPDTSEQSVKYLDLLRALLDKKANPNARLEKKLWFRGLAQDPVWVDSKGATPFWRAAQSSDFAAMKLLAGAGADINLATAQGVTPLMVAAGIGWMANHSTNAPGGWMEAVKFCIERQADVNAADSRGYTPLHGAAYIGHNEMVNYLVAHQAKVNVKTKQGDTVADMANGPTRFGLPHPETVALLEKLGSENSHNCRSDQCLVAPKKDPPPKTPETAKDAPAAATPATRK